MKQESNIVEYNLTAGEFNWEIKPGKTITAWGFNNQVPGLVLKAKKGGKSRHHYIVAMLNTIYSFLLKAILPGSFFCPLFIVKQKLYKSIPPNYNNKALLPD